MKLFLIMLLLVICISIWAVMFPSAEFKLKAETINKLNTKLLVLTKIWGTNRLQTIRIKNDLNDYFQLKIQNSFLNGDRNKYAYMKRQCNKLLIINLRHKKKLIIPCGNQSQSYWFIEELNTLIKNDLNYFYPSIFWNEPKIKRIKATSYFYYIVTEK